MFYSLCNTQMFFFKHKFTLYSLKSNVCYVCTKMTCNYNIFTHCPTKSLCFAQNSKRCNLKAKLSWWRPSKPICACQVAEALESIDSQCDLNYVHHNYFHKSWQTAGWVNSDFSQTPLFLPVPVTLSFSLSFLFPLTLCLLSHGLNRCLCSSRCSGAWLEPEDSNLHT